MRRSDREIDFLLTPRGLPGPEKDRILAQVLASRARRPWWRRPFLPVVAGLALAGAAALVLVPRARRGDEGFSPRGGGAAGAAQLELACAGASLAACPVGATLIFTARGDFPAGHLTAWAQRLGGERIWYFSREGESPRLEPGGARAQAASRGVRLGPEHEPGVYMVHVLLAREPLTREAATMAMPADGATRRVFALTVVAP